VLKKISRRGLKIKFIDLFAGIGGFRLGMEMAGHECVGHCELDRFALKSYEAIHNPKEGEWFAKDIRDVQPSDIPVCDVWCFGFPCQDISVAGKQKGLSGNRSGLYYTVIDKLKGKKEKDRPKYLFIENVKNLLSINGGWDFTRVLSEMDEIGYDAEWQVLNSKDFGVPQNRERVFIIGHFRGRNTRKIFPINRINSKTIERVIGRSQGNRVYSTEGVSSTLSANGGGQGGKTGLYLIQKGVDVGYKSKPKYTDIAKCLLARDCNGIGNQPMTTVEVRAVLTPDREKKRQNGRRVKEPGEPSFTLTSQDKHGVLYGGRIRRLTPRECWRLQGFPDWAFERASKVNSDTQLYKQAGNSVTVNVVFEIAKRM